MAQTAIYSDEPEFHEHEPQGFILKYI